MTKILVDEEDKITIIGTVLDSGKSPISGRTYREEDLERMVEEFNAKGESACFGEIMGVGEEDYGPTTNMAKVSHQVKRLWFEDGSIMAEMKVLGTPHGDIIRELIEDKVGIKPTPVMTGLVEKIDGEDFATDLTLVRVDATEED